MIGSILGARIVYVTTYWHEEFAGQPLMEIFAVWHGGLDLLWRSDWIAHCCGQFVYALEENAGLEKLPMCFAPSIALGKFLAESVACSMAAMSLWATKRIFAVGHHFFQQSNGA